jgi:hypothetical protein
MMILTSTSVLQLKMGYETWGGGVRYSPHTKHSEFVWCETIQTGFDFSRIRDTLHRGPASNP